MSFSKVGSGAPKTEALTNSIAPAANHVCGRKLRRDNDEHRFMNYRSTHQENSCGTRVPPCRPPRAELHSYNDQEMDEPCRAANSKLCGKMADCSSEHFSHADIWR